MYGKFRIWFGFSYSDNRKSKIQNRKWVGFFVIALTYGLGGAAVEALQPKVYRVGVLLPGEAWYEIIDGLRIVRALRAGDVGAYFTVSDPMANNQAQLIIDTARVKKLPTMFDVTSHVIKGGLASYNVSFHEMGRVSAKYGQRILTGVKPKDLPVEGIDKIELVINLKTAKDIGLTVPPNVLARADRVIR